MIKIKIENTTIIIGSIYGPNINDNSNIYDELDIELNRLNTEKVILGGDWNCTVDCRNVDLNIDVLNMAGIPSKLRSEKVKNVFSKYKLTDPYRYFYPNKRDFTYIPANLDATNRSRLDFFGVSETLVTKIGSCCISNALTNPIFDHKEISISFNKERPHPKNKQVQYNSIKDKYVKIQVKTAAIE